MPTFLIAAGVLLAVVVGRLLWLALRFKPSPAHNESDFVHVQTAAIQLAAEHGEIAADDVESAQLDLARGALDDATRAVKPDDANDRERAFLALGVALLVPLIAVSVYALLGSPIAPTTAAKPDHPSPEQMIAELNQRIQAAPQDPEPRMWLARVYMTTHDYMNAVATYKGLYDLVPREPTVLVEYADAITMTTEGKFNEQAESLVQQALKIDPENVTALWLAGIAADQTGDAKAALEYLSHARGVSTSHDLPTNELDTQIAELESRSGLKSPASKSMRSVNASAPRIAVDITLDAALAARVPAEATLFVLAKNPAGPPMPLAVKRMKATTFPITVTLDDSLAMAPQFKLSTAQSVIVTARISSSGQALPQSGDLQGKVADVRVAPNTKVSVTISEVVP